MFPLADLQFDPTAGAEGAAASGFSSAAMVLVIWLAVPLILFLLLRPTRAMLLSLIAGYLFLPHVGLRMPFLIYDKLIALSAGVLIGSLLTDIGRWLRLRPHWIDLPMFVWCIVSLPAAVFNGQTPYEGSAGAVTQLLSYGVPYLLGRAYLNNLEALREMAVSLVIGGLVYIPFCFAEAFVGPFFHLAVYDVMQHDVTQAVREWGFRPMVFLQHGLAVGMFMATATLAAWCLWWTGSRKHLVKIPIWILSLVLLATTILVQSAGAIVLLIGALGLLHLTGLFKKYVFIYLILLAPVVYIGMRTIGDWSGGNLVHYSNQLLGFDRAQSLAYRFYNEDLYIKNDARSPLLGWGVGYNSIVHDETGAMRVVDSLWIISLSTTGVIGLSALLMSTIVPIVVLLRRVPPDWWSSAGFGAASGLVLVMIIVSLDNLANAMINPVFTVIMGGISAMAIRPLASEPEAVATRRRRKTRPERAKRLPPTWKMAAPLSGQVPPKDFLSRK